MAIPHPFKKAPGKIILSALALFVACFTPANSRAWWDEAFTVRQPITVNTAAEGVTITPPTGDAVMLVRLHGGNFDFLAAREDGSDIRFVAADDKTLLPFHLEKYDGLLNEAFAWVKIPDIKEGETTFYLYYGNAEGAGEGGSNPAETFAPDTLLAYHFGERGTAPQDQTSNANHATTAGLAVEGSLIGTGLRLDGSSAIVIPASETLEWQSGVELSTGFWVKPTDAIGKRALLSYGNDTDSFMLGLEAGIPFIEIKNGAEILRTTPGEALSANIWKHIAFTANATGTTLYVDGVEYGTVAAGLPAKTGDLLFGGAPAAPTDFVGFDGETEEFFIRKGVAPIGALQLIAVGQGPSEAAARVLALGEMDAGHAAGGHNQALEHLMLFGDIAKNMMFDGWIAVAVCVLMIIFGWTVAARKFLYLNSIQKGSDLFMKLWQEISSDLTALDVDNPDSVKSIGGKADAKSLRQMKSSPLYHLYHIGSDEVRHRVGRGNDRSNGLSARAMQSIKASLETGLVRENQRMNSGLVFLTMSIAGGPYVGLLGTVVGVMITFAIIAKSGEVDVNSIAPGIASALLATVAGLVVAIPALFMYSFLSSRIKDLLAAMQVFIDEFISKMAEFYPPASESSANNLARAASSPIAMNVPSADISRGHAIGEAPLPSMPGHQANHTT